MRHVMPPLTEDIVRLGKNRPRVYLYLMVTLIGQMRKHAEDGVRKIVMVQGKASAGWAGTPRSWKRSSGKRLSG